MVAASAVALISVYPVVSHGQARRCKGTKSRYQGKCLYPAEIAKIKHADRRACSFAKSEDTVEAWSDYLKKYPRGRCTRLAQSRIGELNELKWQADSRACYEARQSEDTDNWKAYLQNFPGGSCQAQARREINRLTLAKKRQVDESFCQRASSIDTSDSWTRYLSRHPEGICSSRANDRLTELKEEAKEDESDCDTASILNTCEYWLDYLEEHPKGVCALKARGRVSQVCSQELDRAKRSRIGGIITTVAGFVSLGIGIGGVVLYTSNKDETGSDSDLPIAAGTYMSVGGFIGALTCLLAGPISWYKSNKSIDELKRKRSKWALNSTRLAISHEQEKVNSSSKRSTSSGALTKRIGIGGSISNQEQVLVVGFSW